MKVIFFLYLRFWFIRMATVSACPRTAIITGRFTGQQIVGAFSYQQVKFFPGFEVNNGLCQIDVGETNSVAFEDLLTKMIFMVFNT